MQLIVDNPRNFKFRENLLWLGLTSLITVLIWIGYSIYTAYNTSVPDEDVALLLEPLSPELDTELLAELLQRQEPTGQFSIVVAQDDDALSLPAASVASGAGLLNN